MPSDECTGFLRPISFVADGSIIGGSTISNGYGSSSLASLNLDREVGSLAIVGAKREKCRLMLK
jgi:hypothetical protein